MRLQGWLVGVGFALLVLAGCGSGSSEDAESAAPDPASTVESEPETGELETPEPAPTTLSESKPEALPTATPVQATPTSVPAAVAESGLEDAVPVVFADDFGTSIQPIFANHCASCHNTGGPGASHWTLATAADLVATHSWISETVQSRSMPPWPASGLSLPFHDERNLRSDEMAAIAAWSEAGAPLDVDARTAIQAPDGVVALDADAQFSPHESYTGSLAVTDDYRCFIYDLDLDEPAWMAGYEFVPDQTEVVHHAIGYLAPARSRSFAQTLSDQDDAGGWQCYGGSGLGSADSLFLGWAPGQLPVEYPEGAGVLVEPGSFVVMQIHYHFDDAEATDASTFRIKWSDRGDLDPIDFSEFLGPAEIPCAAGETGPLCDRDAAVKRAIDTYGPEGVLADSINALCGVTAEDFAHMTEGIASSSCAFPVRSFGEIVSVFGHEHEIGKSFRMTLNAGSPDERILLDISDWDFDWQYNYYPSESINLEPGDTVLLECTWDRSRRALDLEPAYVLWADGTNDEMCFAIIAVRGRSISEAALGSELAGPIPEKIASCLEASGVSLDMAPERDAIDSIVDDLFACAGPDEIGRAFASVISANFAGFVAPTNTACFADAFGSPDAVRDLLVFGLPDSSRDEREPLGELVADCVPMSDALSAFGFPLPGEASACIDEVGRPILVEATIASELPEAQAIFGEISPCLVGG